MPLSTASRATCSCRKAPAATIETLAQAVLELKHSDLGVQTIGTRHGEKLFEVLVTSEEMLRAEDLPGFFRIRADSRDLNYDNYFSKGTRSCPRSSPILPIIPSGSTSTV